VTSNNFLNDYIFSNHNSSEKIFIETENDKITFTDFDKLANKISNVLINLKLKKNDRVLVQLEKSVISFAIFIAAIRVGCIYIPLNPSYTASEVEYFIENSKPSLFISEEKNINELKKVFKNQSVKTISLNKGFSGSLMNLINKQSAEFIPVKRGKNDIASILYTSGTTGRSKGAMLTHNNLVSNTIELVKLWKFDKKDILLHALPIYHIHGLFVACNIALMSGIKMYFLEKFDVDQVIKYLPKSTAMMGVPTFYTRLLDSEKFSAEVAKNIRVFISGSAPLLPETHNKFESISGHKILERYGMTETNMNASNPYDGERKAGTVGFPLPGISIRITDVKNGKTIENENIGMIEIKGENVFQGYWEMDGETNKSFTKDNYFITGDLGKISLDGYLTIIGRNKDLIISGGLNIYPKEIELVLDQIDQVKETAVIGVPHKDFGEAVVAVIVASGGKPSEKYVMSLTQNKLAKFKQPKKLFFIPELPRNAMGKVQKQVLRNNYKEFFS